MNNKNLKRTDNVRNKSGHVARAGIVRQTEQNRFERGDRAGVVRGGGRGNRERLRLEISALSSDGAGIARTDHGVVFVTGALPGETVIAELTSRHKDFATARVFDIEHPSAGRRIPPCAVSDRCGGCPLMHADYSMQLVLKAGLVRDAMTRIGGFTQDQLADLVCEASPKSLGYRNKASFPVQAAQARNTGRIVTGFYHAGTHRIEPITTCPVNAEPIDAIFKSIVEGLNDLPFAIDGYDERSNTGKLRHLVIRSGINTGESLLSFVLNGKLSARGIKALVALGNRGQAMRPKTITLNHNSRPGNTILGTHTESLTGNGLITEKLDRWTLAFDTTSFFQVNTGQAEKLFAWASSLACGDGANKTSEPRRILELYSGVGSLTCFLAGRDCVESVTSVEEWRSAVALAERNLRANNIHNVQTLCGRSEDLIDDIAHGPFSYNTVVLDPPRSGCERPVIEAIHRLAIPRVVYVSCNPATLARDCKILAGHGYELNSIKSFDMFPQTAHVETVALLTLKH